MSAADIAVAPTSFVPASTFGATHPPARLLRSPALATLHPRGMPL